MWNFYHSKWVNCSTWPHTENASSKVEHYILKRKKYRILASNSIDQYFTLNFFATLCFFLQCSSAIYVYLCFCGSCARSLDFKIILSFSFGHWPTNLNLQSTKSSMLNVIHKLEHCVMVSKFEQILLWFRNGNSQSKKIYYFISTREREREKRKVQRKVEMKTVKWLRSLSDVFLSYE